MSDEPEYTTYYGGATTFDELTSYRETEDDVRVVTSDYQKLASNIWNDEELSASDKSAAILTLNNQYAELVESYKHPGHATQKVHGHGSSGGGGGGGGSATTGGTDHSAFLSSVKKGDIVRARGDFGGRDVQITGAVTKFTDGSMTLKGQAKIDGKSSVETITFGQGKWTAENLTRSKERTDEKAGRRMNKAQQSTFRNAMDSLKKLFNWSNYEDDDSDDDDDDSKELDFTEASGFKLVETDDGLRWIAFSSNAFLDHDKEIFTTQALEDAVKAADDGDWKVADDSPRGPLRVFHIPGADIGDADFQGIVGRFLVESGTFRDDELGQAAVKYLKGHKDEKLQVSIGYRYKVGDEEDGVYDWVRITERSILPEGSAANPYTSFTLGGDEEMAELDERKAKMLNDWFGEEKAAQLIGKAQTQSKELEGSVRFKSKDDEPNPLLDDLKALVADASVPEETRNNVKAMLEKHGIKEEPPAPDGEPDVDDGITKAFELFNTTVEALNDRITALSGVDEAVKSLQTAVNSLAADVKSMKDAPRAASVFRPTESSDNRIDPEKAKEMTGEHADPPVNAAAEHVARLLKLNAN